MNTEPFIQRYFVEGLAHASYLIGVGGVAAVVDPKRDVDDYIADARRLGCQIIAILETHSHADFVSGHLELAQRTGAPIYISRHAVATYPHRDMVDGEVTVCDLRSELRGGRPPLVVDVRSASEWQAGHIAEARHAALPTLPGALGNLPRDTAMAVICNGGYRSSMAASVRGHKMP